MVRINRYRKKKKKNRQESRIRHTTKEGGKIIDNTFGENERILVAREADIEKDSQADMGTKI